MKFPSPAPETASISPKFKSLGAQGDEWLRSAFVKICETVSDEAVTAALQDLHSDEPERLSLEYTALEQPEVEDSWHPLPIDRRNTSYDKAISAAEEAIEIIEGNNGYAQTEPEERNAIVAIIRGNIKAIKEGAPSLATIKAGLIAPLQFLAKKFADAAIGIAAKVAVEKLLHWLSQVPF